MKKVLIIIVLIFCYRQHVVAQAYTLHAFRANISTDTGATGEISVNIPITIYTAGNTDSVRKIEYNYNKQVILTVDSIYLIVKMATGCGLEASCIDQEGTRYYLRMARGDKDKTWSMLSILNEKGLINATNGENSDKGDMKGSAMFNLKS